MSSLFLDSKEKKARKISMAQLWGGRFTKETDKLVYNFNASISFDQKFYKQDMEGSIAHVKMLASVGILTEEERDQIITGIEGILRDVENGSLIITEEYEDIQYIRIGKEGEFLDLGVAYSTDEYHSKGAIELEKVIREVYSDEKYDILG